MIRTLLALTAVVALAACGQKAPEDAGVCAGQPQGKGQMVNLAPGLDARILNNGYGRSAQPGDLAEVHYTGWLYDENAEDGRGEKFDSSVDRGQAFSFPLGAGRVIRGWDQGVQCMLEGETRELTIAPEMGYGDRDMGVIPPGSTLVFEVELKKVIRPDDGAAGE